MPVTPDTQFSAAVAAFCAQHGITLRRLSELGGGASNHFSRSQAYRLLHNEPLNPAHLAAVRPVLAHSLRGVLTEKHLTAEQIERELLTLFTLQEIRQMNVRATLSRESCALLGLQRDPFTDDPRSRREVFTSPAFDKVFDRTLDAVKYQQFVAVLGDIGTGKTTLRRRLQEHADHSQQPTIRLIWPEFFDMSKVSAPAIAKFILTELETGVPADSVARAAKVRRVLAEYYKKDTRIALCFDECHRLDGKVLSALKNFWEMGSGGFTKYLGVLLFGQPQFEARLRDFTFREIAERVQVVRMPTLEKSGADYLRHRLALAGGDLDALFTPDAVKLLCKQAQTPLALGNLANAALEKAALEFGETCVQASFLTQTGVVTAEPTVRALRKKAS